MLRDGRAYVQAGAGIVADSDPDTEYQESVNKATVVLRAISVAGTLRPAGPGDNAADAAADNAAADAAEDADATADATHRNAADRAADATHRNAADATHRNAADASVRTAGEPQ